MLDRVIRTVERHGMFTPGQRVGVAVSGGSDSVALLHALYELAPRWNLHLRVLHLDHLLRGAESAGDAAFVAGLAHSLGLPLESRATDVARLAAETGDNLEQVARRARLRFFLEFIEQGVLDRVALGHTRSDQAETVLFRLLRGSGAAGLAGIRPVTRDGLVRPLIDVTRQEVSEFLRARDLGWREDSSNLDPKYARNRIRHSLLPRLRSEWNPAVDEVLANMATVAADEESYWADEVERLAASLVTPHPPAVVLDCTRLRNLPDAAARRLLRHAIGQAKGNLRGIDYCHTERLTDLARSAAGEGEIQLPGVTAVRSLDWVRLAPEGVPEPAAEYCVPLPIPGQAALAGGSTLVCCEAVSDEGEENGGYNTEKGCKLDGERIPGPLVVRNWKPGDRLRPVGAHQAQKMKELFQRARIPVWERRGWPIVSSGDTIIWTRRFGAASEFVPGSRSSRILRVWEMDLQGVL